MDDKQIIAQLTADLSKSEASCRHYILAINQQYEEIARLRKALAEITAERDFYQSQVQNGLIEEFFGGVQPDTT